MSASSQSFPRPSLSFTPLTITEVEVEPSLVLGTSKIYLFAVAGTALGILCGVVFATTSWLPGRLAGWRYQVPSAVQAEAATKGPHGPRDFGSVKAIAAGLKAHLKTDGKDNPSYSLEIEPGDLEQQPGFAMAVTAPPRPMSVAFQLLDSTGTVLCGKDIVVRFDAARAAAARAQAARNAEAAANGEPIEPVEQMEAREQVRERGRDIFGIEIDRDGQISAITAQGKMLCSNQDYEHAVSWNLTPDFPSVSEQIALAKQDAGPKDAQAHKSSSAKSKEARKETAQLDGLLMPAAARR